MTRLIFLLAIAALVLGCSGDDDSLGPIVVEHGGYPATLGSHWMYLQTDSTHGTSDTLRSAITDTFTTSNGVRVAVMNTSLGQCFRTLYVLVDGDSVRVRTTADSTGYTFQVYAFPLRVGTSCHCMYENDSMRVVGRDDVVTQVGTFHNAYVLERTYLVFESYLFDRIWFVPDVGIVKRYVYEDEYSMGTTAVIYSWELLDYGIAD